MSELPILIIGGAGKTGRRVDARLQARGIATRPASARDFSDYAGATAAAGVWGV